MAQKTDRQVTLYVVRARPPELARCRGEGCGRTIEWVTTHPNGRRMPVTSPLTVVRVHEREDGTKLHVIDASQAHFSNCPAAQKFRRATRKKATQGRLFEDDGGTM